MPGDVEIIEPGLLATIQDEGRRGVAQLGVSPSGAADWLSARIANRLVGNPRGEALIEATLTGPSFTARRRLRIAVTGADVTLWVNGESRPCWRSADVSSGAQVKISAAARGVRSYIAFQGGIDVAPVLGSASTDVAGGFGGLHGRPLARGDVIRLKPTEEATHKEAGVLAPQTQPIWESPAQLRVVLGPSAARLTPDQRTFLLRQRYRVSPHSNRQGMRLDGNPLRGGGGWDALSFGVCLGCVQLTSDGHPIILLAEHQTTGGYVVPIVVITADTPYAAQLRPGDEVGFTLVTRADAAAALTTRMLALTAGIT